MGGCAGCWRSFDKDKRQKESTLKEARSYFSACPFIVAHFYLTFVLNFSLRRLDYLIFDILNT